MGPIYWAKDDAGVGTLLDEFNAQRGSNLSLEDVQNFGIFAGTSSQIVEQLGRYVDAGCQRFMLQITEYDDLTPVEAWAEEILPHFHHQR